MSIKLRKSHLFILGALVLIIAGLIGKSLFSKDPFNTGNPLQTDAAQNGQIDLLPENFDIANLPLGWTHRKFWRITPTDYSLTTIDQRSAMHCATNDSGSILARDTSIALTDFPILRWQWKIETPLISDIDEETRDGDDHPARFFVLFENDEGSKSAAEIIWSNTRFEPGDYKIIGDFHHLVANGLNQSVGIWHDQEVDLQALYTKISGSAGPAKLSLLGFFCDSDNTGGSTSAYFADVRLVPRSN